MDASENIVDASENIVDASENVVDVSENVVDASENVVDASENVVNLPPPPPPVITLADIMNATELVQQKETADKSLLESIGNVSFESLRSKLIQWASTGFPNAYQLMSISISPPQVCSDGITRGLPDYIVFCSGKTINEHVDLLQQKLPDMTVSFANMGGSIAIVVSKKD
jgi:hypothetical protein